MISGDLEDGKNTRAPIYGARVISVDVAVYAERSRPLDREEE